MVPIIDLGLDGRPGDRAATARSVGRACATGGFFVAVGHGVPVATIEAVYDAGARFFRLPDDVKEALTADPHDPLQRGFVGGDLEKFSLSRVGEPGRAQPVRPTVGLPNRWPDLPGFRESCLAYYTALESLALELMRLFAVALTLPERWFDNKFDNHMTQFAINHYRPSTVAFGDREFRNDPHRDWGTLTLLHQGGPLGGLQILTQSQQWVDVSPRPDAFVVHIGDLMARWTNDRWTSALHRVANPPEGDAHRDRTSLAFFHQPNPDAIVECLSTCATADEPPRYPPVTSYDYIVAKVRRAFAAGRLARNP